MLPPICILDGKPKPALNLDELAVKMNISLFFIGRFSSTSGEAILNLGCSNCRLCKFGSDIIGNCYGPMSKREGNTSRVHDLSERKVVQRFTV